MRKCYSETKSLFHGDTEVSRGCLIPNEALLQSFKEIRLRKKVAGSEASRHPPNVCRVPVVFPGSSGATLSLSRGCPDDDRGRFSEAGRGASKAAFHQPSEARQRCEK